MILSVDQRPRPRGASREVSSYRAQLMSALRKCDADAAAVAARALCEAKRAQQVEAARQVLRDAGLLAEADGGDQT